MIAVTQPAISPALDIAAPVLSAPPVRVMVIVEPPIFPIDPIVALSDDLRKVASGDPAAYDRVFTKTRDKLYGICLRVCGDPSGAEDVLAEVYLSVWKRASTWQAGRASPITWLCAIARNRSIDWLRKQKPGASLPLEYAAHVVDPQLDCVTVLCDEQTNAGIRESVARLSPRQQYAINRAFFDGATYPELAAEAGVPLGTMKSWVRRGLAQIKRDIDAQDA